MPITPQPTLSAAEHEILHQVRSLKFGSVEIQVHEGRIVQIERRERQRLDDIKPR